MNALNQILFLREDLERLRFNSLKELFYLMFEQGVWVVVLFRFTRMLYLINIPVIKIILRILAFLISKLYEIILGVLLSPSTDVGPGLYIGHTRGIVIHPEVKIGKMASIAQGVTIGTKGLGDTEVPNIGDNVFIGSGAKVLGGIQIGNNVRIGANAVVITDVSDNATAVGVPAKIIIKK